MTGRFKWIGMNEAQTKVVLEALAGFTVPLKNFSTLSPSLSTRIATVLDVETTGLNQVEDRIIELCARNIIFDIHTGEVMAISEEVFSSLNDPGVPVSQNIQIVTGLSDQVLAGNKIDWNDFDKYIENSQMIISHNASFDRAFLERSHKDLDVVWGCSMQNIDWIKKGYDSAKLNLLCIYHGFFNQSHRARTDVDSLIHLLTFKDLGGRTYFNELLINSHQPKSMISIENATFEERHLFKKSGFRWNPREKIWFKIVPKELAKDLLASINLPITVNFSIKDIPLTHNFKSILNYSS
ncbi:hypothetical protein DOM22_18910 [Bdellovibrio sp. ZAP7]|uniref:3'-5' exonuclease n=1 Tax=Bdellovibrio sp. ZAP7 TaxID=2231053 RepID=UPI00115BEEA0|nr:3'-5' exonuclease [Bdellovibrio sp. ZAP7]QDK47085.1 hypothetical protein DOM22_18910 [Bdellovibrio sp. ZAP7]